MRQIFGTLADGRKVERVRLEKNGLRAWIITRGAALQDLRLDRFTHPLVLGFDRLEDYLEHPRYFGANVGRFANRLNQGKVHISGRDYQLDLNERGIQTLHGGSDGSGNRLWKIEELGESHVILSDRLPDMHMGFPGALEVTLKYEIGPGPCLEIEICAQSDQDTLCNFAHHSYFNLDGSDTILDHHLQIEADTILAIDENKIPTGDLRNVAGTPFDFRKSRPVSWQGKPFGYDHNYCLSNARREPRAVAHLHGPGSDLTMTIITTEPGLQVFDGANTVSISQGHLGRLYKSNAGIAMEPQCWPDAPNQDNFPSAELAAGAKYRQLTRFKFR
jgi:aldose 1-epimerase